MTKRIVLACNEPTVRDPLTDLLAGEELTVTATLNGRHTLECVGDQPPDLLILDLDMPAVDGQDIVRVLHERELTRFPILVFTGGADRGSTNGGEDAVALRATDLDQVVILAKRLIGDVVQCESEATVGG